MYAQPGLIGLRNCHAVRSSWRHRSRACRALIPTKSHSVGPSDQCLSHGKPELGLPCVKRASRHFGPESSWYREPQATTRLSGSRIPLHRWVGHNANLTMRILMLGGTNLTGPYAIRRLHALGHEVSVFHRGEHEADLPWSVRHIHGDFRRLPREAFDPAPEVIVHMWAMTERGCRVVRERISWGSKPCSCDFERRCVPRLWMLGKA